MSDQLFRKMIQVTDAKSKKRLFRVGLPLISGIFALSLGLLNSGIALPLVGALMLYVAWLKYENCKMAGQVFQTMEFLADKYQRHGSALHHQENSY